MARLTKFVNIGVTEDTRIKVNARTVWAMGLVGRRLTMSEVISAALDVAERHPDELEKTLRSAP